MVRDLRRPAAVVSQKAPSKTNTEGPDRPIVHARHVEPDLRRDGRRSRRNASASARSSPLLPPRHRLERPAEPRARPGLHLAEHQEPAAERDEVDLAQGAPPVAGHYAEAGGGVPAGPRHPRPNVPDRGGPGRRPCPGVWPVAPTRRVRSGRVQTPAGGRSSGGSASLGAMSRWASSSTLTSLRRDHRHLGDEPGRPVHVPHPGVRELHLEPHAPHGVVLGHFDRIGEVEATLGLHRRS